MLTSKKNVDVQSSKKAAPYPRILLFSYFQTEAKKKEKIRKKKKKIRNQNKHLKQAGKNK